MPDVPAHLVPGPVTAAELAQRRLVHGLSGPGAEVLPLLRRLLQRRGPEICARATEELLQVPWAGLAGAPELTGLVSLASLDALVGCALDPLVADQRARLGAAHAWLGLDAHAVAVVAEALCQSVDLALDEAGVGRGERAYFRRAAALDGGVRLDGYTFAAGRIAATTPDGAVLTPDAFLRACASELARAFRRAEPLTVIVASLGPAARAQAAAARRSCRPGDVVGITGPGEVAVALVSATPAGAGRFALRWLGDDATTAPLGAAASEPFESPRPEDLLARARVTPLLLGPLEPPPPPFAEL